MKNLKLLVVALVAMFGFIACEQHECNDYDHSADLVGTWTCLQEGYAEALVIKTDGTALSTGYDGEEFWENVAGSFVVENGMVTMTFEDGDNFHGHFDIIPGMAFSIFNEEGERLTFNYCKEDLAEEIVGMWVCNDSKVEAKNDMLLQTFNEGGTTVMTGYLPEGEDAEYVLNEEGDYKVVGDLVFIGISTNKDGDNNPFYVAKRLIYTPDATANGDIMTFRFYLPMGNDIVEASESWLRIKQTLDFTGKTYDYSSAYVSNAKGKDEDFSMLGHTFNMSNIKGHNFDMMFRSELFCIDLNANSITQRFRANGRDIEIVIPITVDDNKVTLDLSAENPAYRKVDMYMFQDADNSQLHMYMHTNDFINYFANMELYNLLAAGEITADNTTAIEKVYTDMEARIESINVSFVFKARK